MNRIISGIIIVLFLSCGHSKKNVVAVKFNNIENFYKNGFPNDSLVKYFPFELFQDALENEMSDTSCLKIYSYMVSLR